MITLRKLFTVALAWTFLSAMISVIESRELYSTSASVNLTEEMQNSTESVEMMEEILPSVATLVKNDERLNYPCDSEACLSLCCPPGKVHVDGKCVDNNATSENLPRMITSTDKKDGEEEVTGRQGVYLISNDPCAITWMSTTITNDFYVLPNGSIYVPNYAGGSFLDFENYCLFLQPGSTIYSAKVCNPWIERAYWQIACFVSVTIVLLAIFICYSIVPELRNLHGLMFRAYLVTYVGCQVCVIGQQLTTGSRTFAHLFTFFVYTLHYCAGGCALWLNAMCFNIWRSFRYLQTVDKNTRDHERKKFIWYAIYAWVTPAVWNGAVTAIMCYVPALRNRSLNQSLILWTCAASLTAACIFNSFLYASTALTIRQHQKDTGFLANGTVNKHSEVDKQWFNLHVKLFFIVGAHTIMWVIWEMWPTRVNTYLMVAVEVVQSILIFIVFVCKANVRRSLRKQFNETLCLLKRTFGISPATTVTKT